MLNGIMHTHSEAQAEMFKFRKLLNFRLNQQFKIKESQNKQIRFPDACFPLKQCTEDFINRSVEGLNDF